jgi:DnaK suppressor protein
MYRRETVMIRGCFLTRQQLGELEAALSSERLRLERMTDIHAEADPWATTGDAVSTLVEREVSAAVQTRAETRYGAIVDALHRLETGAYGVCVSCGDPIPYGRLVAMPEASQCIACAPRE